ncbi:hypothetical protein B0H63DRAFT_59927 [Podospora didyma]|uniref:F-box domain-containing protein n=1 Tax=Podospora didyma TaxID=330526 RepID=A0AAE0P7M9_9PEZI|nr:hypothetical protein B0H63DRAFT_59927 [Podospora didyma]
MPPNEYVVNEELGHTHPRTAQGEVGDNGPTQSAPLLENAESERHNLPEESDSTLRLAGIADDRLAVSRKRKSPEDSERNDASWPGNEGSKKVKLSEDHATQLSSSSGTGASQGQDNSLLPAEIWHHIFTFCPPKSLGNLLCVNKLFNNYLDPSSVRREFPVSEATTTLSTLKPNAIWQASRRLFWPYMPAPLRFKTELEMWRLACSRSCEACKKLSSREEASPADPLHPGPGVDGVALIWPFGSRLCGSCLLQQSVKELDLILSPSVPSAIMPALPSVLLTQNLQMIPPSALGQSQMPSNLQTTKFFSASDVEALKQEFLEVKGMGPGTVDEWLKGLTGKGNDLRQEASKWEKWDVSGGVERMRSQLYPGYTKEVSLAVTAADQPAPIEPPSAPSQQHLPSVRRERTVEEVVELKGARKAEIERRAMLLDPPLTADVLRHIPSYQAATHIIAPLDDQAWELLKPRLLTQRADAEQRERENIAQTKTKQERVENRHLEATLATTKEARDLIDKDWEDIQAPVRAKIASYADEIIRDGWDKAKKVKRENCSKFATDVLLYVRKRFYAKIAKDAAAARAAGQDPPNDPPEGPFTQKLTLENMKWIFDTKIKPHTESHRKEIFFCNGCEGNYKTFGFEGVIQHYAAKHTNTLSSGSIIVHWRAEWPEHPPFAHEARAASVPAYAQASSGIFPNPAGPSPQATYSPYHSVSGNPVPPTYPPYSGYGYGTTAYGDQYYHQPPAQPYHAQAVLPAYAPPLAYGQQQQQQQQPYAPQSSPYQNYPPTTGPYLPPVVDQTPGFVTAQGGNYNYNYGSYQANPQAAYSGAPVPVPAYPDQYQAKLEDVVRNSREVWQSLANIKDLPGSARVFITIHHLVKRYHSRFYEAPPLTMFIDGLSNNKDMRPVRNVNNLFCKACHLGLGNAASVEKDKKSFSLPQLVNHFQAKHVEPMQHIGPPLDWVVDMVMRPDPALISNLRPFLNEGQRVLVADAFPDAFQPSHVAAEAHHGQQTPYQHQPVYASGYPISSTDTRSAFLGETQQQQTSNRYSNENGTANGHSSDPQPVESHPSRDSFNLSHHYASGVPHNGAYKVSNKTSTPAALPVASEHDRAAQAGRQSAPRPHREQNSHQSNNRKRAEKSKRGKGHGAAEASKRAVKEETKNAEDEARSEEEKIRAMWAADRAETARVYSSSTKPIKAEAGAEQNAAPPARRQSTDMPQHIQKLPSPRPLNSTIPFKEPEVESSLLSALEMHLDRRRLPTAAGRQRTQASARHSEAGTTSGVTASTRHVPETYTQYKDADKDSTFQPYEARRSHSGPGLLHLNDSGRPEDPIEPAHYSRPGPVERDRARHSDYTRQPEFRDRLPHHSEDDRYDRGPPSRAIEIGYSIAPQSEYYRYPEDTRRISSRQPVETYEIVHVIDPERGEYYIRRPVRHEPESVYAYDERRPHREADPYPPHEPVYVPVARAARESLGYNTPPRTRPAGGRREDPAYYEEYDPRFPAA